MRKYYYELKLKKLIPESEKVNSKYTDILFNKKEYDRLIDMTDSNTEGFLTFFAIVAYALSAWIQIQFFHIGIAAWFLSLIYAFFTPGIMLILINLPSWIMDAQKERLCNKKKELDELKNTYQKRLLDLKEDTNV